MPFSGWCVVGLLLAACAEPADRLVVEGRVGEIDRVELDGGSVTTDAGPSACPEVLVPRTMCAGPCDDGDPCTTDTCSVATGFTCLSTPRCPGSLCVAGQCVTQICTPSREVFGPCALHDGQQCTVLLADGGTGVSASPGRARAQCTPDEECTPEGTTCLPAPDRTLIVWPLDAGPLLSDGGLPVAVAVYGVRTGVDTAFQLRPGTAALQQLGFQPPTQLVFPPTFRWDPGAAYVVTREGDVVQHLEAEANPGWLCELFDCFAPRPLPRRTTPAGTWLRQSWGEARFGRPPPPYEASGDFVVHVFTFFDGAQPEWSLGHTLATLPAGCDPNIDAVRDSWNRWARMWTSGALGLRFSFVDHGVAPLPDDETLARLGPSSVPADPFRNESAVLGLAAMQLPQRGPRDLLLVAYVAADGFGGGGVARPSTGVALARVPRSRAAFRAGVALHELGHLFGAVDLYDGRSPSGCAPEAGDEFTPDLYCWSMGVSRLNARELGWLLPDGGAAPIVTHACQSPTSSFGCDPE